MRQTRTHKTFKAQPESCHTFTVIFFTQKFQRLIHVGKEILSTILQKM